MTAVQTFVPGDIVVIGENDSGIRVGSSGEVIRLLDNGSVVVEVLPGKRYTVAPRHVSLKTSDRPERAVPPLWRIGDKVRCTHDVDDGPKAGTPGWVFGSHVVPGQVKVKFPEHGIMVVPSAELEPDPNQSSVSRARDASGRDWLKSVGTPPRRSGPQRPLSRSPKPTLRGRRRRLRASGTSGSGNQRRRRHSWRRWPRCRSCSTSRRVGHRRSGSHAAR